MRLLDFLFPVRSDEEVVRDTTPDTFLRLLEPRPIPYTLPPTIALLPFHTKQVRAVLHEAKYHGNKKAFDLLGATLSEYLADLDQLEARDICVVPVPLSRTRERTRGFNQVAEIITAAGYEGTASLSRVRDTASQISLSKEDRRENMQGAFAAHTPLDPMKLYVLVDDVSTTGATIQAAIDTLTAAGARHILPIALAH